MRSKEIVSILSKLKDEGKIILIATHNLGSASPEFCDKTILLNQEVIASGRTKDVFTQSNLEKTFGGTLRQFILPGKDLHTDKDERGITVLSDDERL